MGEGKVGMIWEMAEDQYEKMKEKNHLSMFDTGYRMLGTGALG